MGSSHRAHPEGHQSFTINHIDSFHLIELQHSTLFVERNLGWNEDAPPWELGGLDFLQDWCDRRGGRRRRSWYAGGVEEEGGLFAQGMGELPLLARCSSSSERVHGEAGAGGGDEGEGRDSIFC